MKRVIALLLLLGMMVPVFAQENKTWYPYDVPDVIERQDKVYNSLSNAQQELVDRLLDQIYDPIYDEFIENTYADVSGRLLQLAQKYQEVKEADPQVGRLLGSMMAWIDFSCEERGNDFYFAHFVMDTAFKLQNERLTDASTLMQFARDLQQDYDSFLKQ